MALKTHAFISFIDIILPLMHHIQPLELRLAVTSVVTLSYQVWLPLLVIMLNFGTVREGASMLWDTMVEAMTGTQGQGPLFELQQ